jgi:ribose transport system substrate-binding protein
MGSVIARDLNGKGEILILTGLPTQPSLNQRVDGIRDYLTEKAPGITIAQVTSHEGNVTKAVSDTENMVEANPQFSAIVGIDANTGPAFINVWKQKGWTGKDHKIIVFDDVPDNIQGMKDGYVKSIVSQREKVWAKDSLDLLNAILDGKEVPDYTDTGSVEITMDNVSTYMEDPFWVEK